MTSLTRVWLLGLLLTEQFVVGVVSFLYPDLSSHVRRSMLPHHVDLGLLLTVLPTVTICLGLLEKTTLMQRAASKVRADEMAHGRWLANIAGMLALAGMAAVMYVLRSGETGSENEAASEDEGAAAEVGEEGVSQADKDGNGEHVEGERSVFAVPVPYPTEASSLLHSTGDGKRDVDESVGAVEESAPPASFGTYVDEMLDKHFSRRSSREGHAAHVNVRMDEYGSGAQYRREPDRHGGRSTESTGSRRSSGAPSVRVDVRAASRAVAEQPSPDSSPDSMWPRFKGVGAGGVILKSP